MKTTTIVQTIGLSILMTLTSVTMADAQNSRSRATQSNQKPIVKYKIDNDRQRTTQQVPTKVYEPRQATKNLNRTRPSQATKATSQHPSKATKSKGSKGSYSQNKGSNSSHGKVQQKSGSYHSSWNYNYNKRPVQFAYNGHNHGINVAHRQPRLRVNLPQGFFGLTLDGVRYYHNDGFFYRQHPHHGFIQVTPPKYFRHIPAGSVRVTIDGRVYYRYNNLIFKHTAFGFRFA